MTNTASTSTTHAWPLWLAGLASSSPAASKAVGGGPIVVSNGAAGCVPRSSAVSSAGVTCAARLAGSRLVRGVAVAGVFVAGLVAATHPPGSTHAGTKRADDVLGDGHHVGGGNLGRTALGSIATRAHLTDAPATLAETGLYSDWASKTVAADVLAFSPQYPLWSDGATKQRWIYLPSAIDARDADTWVFPVGTRIWKQFSFDARVETRFMVLTTTGWKYATYAWRGETAMRAPREGVALPVSATQTHRVPSEIDCRACHGNARTPVLGFASLQLSVDRDLQAPHRSLETLDGRAGAPRVDLLSLAIGGYLHGLDHIAPRIAGGPVQRAALGYLHGNCGGCHRAEGPLAGLGMVLAQRADGGEVTLRGTAGVTGKFAPAPRIAPGDAEHSLLVARMQARRSLAQMPPFGTDVVDAEALRLVADWIDQLPTTKH